MHFANLVIFIVALAFAAVSPGPGVTALVARVLGRGTNGALTFAAGLAVGDTIWLSLAIGGLALLAQTFQTVLIAAKWAGVAYLLYLSWKMWTARDTPAQIAENKRSESSTVLFLTGLGVTMANPKVMLFYLALLPTLLDLTKITAFGYAELITATLGVLAIVFGGYIVLAARIRTIFTRRKAIRSVNRGSACVMAGAAAWLAIKS